MKEFRTKEGPYPIRLIYETAEIDQICEDALRQCGHLPRSPQPIKIDRFLEKYFEVRVVYQDLGDGTIGCTAFNRHGRVTGFIISSALDADGTKSAGRRTRSTLAHEGGHGLLHPRLFLADGNSGTLFGSKPGDTSRILCRNQDVGAATAKPVYTGRWWEWQANRAIAGLLLPKKLVTAALGEILNKEGMLHVLPEARRRDAEALVAESFDVNPAVARIRLEEMFQVSEQMTF
jgi:hypothetical protein